MRKEDNTPALRFPEFKGEWVEKKLWQISNWSSGGTPSKVNPLYWNGDIPWISASSMRGIEYFDSEHKITLEGLKNGSRLVPKGNLLILVRGSMLFNTIPIGITARDVAFNQDVKSIVVDEKNSTKFVLYWFFSAENVILNMVTGTGIGAGKLDLSDLINLPLQIPTLPEQQKIASFLASVDEKLTQLKKQKALIEQYKKGVMQKIFLQEIRFKDENGEEFPEWEEKKLGDVAVKKSSSIAANKIEDNNGEFIIYGAAGVLKTINFFTESDNYVSIVKDGAGVGRLFYCAGKTSVLGTLDIIKPKSEINTHFLFALLENIDFTKYITGSTIPHIYFKDYSHTKFKVPYLAEQTKIANFLSALDDKINHCSVQIEKTEQWKKGLLQKMFC